MKKMMKLAVAAAMSLSMATGMMVPAGAAENFDGCLNVAIPSDPTDLAPYVVMSVGRMYTLETIYEYLGLYEEKNGEFVGQLAKSFQVSEDALTVEVELYDYITDSAGNAITTEDVKFCYETAIEAQCSIALGSLEEIEIVDDYHMIFRLNSALVDGWQGVLSAIPIVSRASYEGNEAAFSQNPVTTSAYVVDSFVAGSSLHLTRREDYWQQEEELQAIHNYPDEIEFDVVLEASQMSIALETGAVELAEGMATNEIERFEEGGDSSEGFMTVGTPENRVYTLLFNMSDEGFFKDKPVELRMAIAKAVDNAGLVAGVLNGGGDACEIPGSMHSSDYNAETMAVDYLSYDPEAAAELLSEAGYNAGDLTLRLACQNGGYGSATIELIQAYLLEIGIETELNVVDAGLFESIKYNPEEWDLLVDGIGGGTFIASYAHQWDTTGKDYGNGNLYFNDELQAVVNAVQEVPTHTEETCMAWVNYINENALFKSLFTSNSYVACVDYLDNIVFTPRSCVFPGDVIVK